MKLKKLRVGYVQQKCGPDKQTNSARTLQGIRECSDSGAQLVILQELHTTQYFCKSINADNFSLAETIPGVTTDALGNLAKELKIVIVGSIFERRRNRIFSNTAVAIDKDGTIAGIYRKMHIPQEHLYNEKFYFAPGDLGFRPVKTSLCSIGILVCYDQWFPESARLLALNGAEIIVCPSAIGWPLRSDGKTDNAETEAWEIAQRAHSISNGLPLVCVNRVGEEILLDGQGLKFWGGSFICGPFGEILAKSPSDKDDTQVAEIDFDRIKRIRKEWPFLKTRRIDSYNKLNRKMSR